MTHSRTNPSPRYRALVEMYTRMHVEGDREHALEPDATFNGKSLLPQVARIKALVDRTQSRQLLDYGSGKAQLYDRASIDVPGVGRIDNLIDWWGVDEVQCYDPCYPPYRERPTGRFDGVLCTDVLEHCPEEDMAWIVEDLFAYATRFVYANIACYPAMKQLPDGTNAHCTIQPPAWWRGLFEAAAARHPDVAWEAWVIVREKAPEGTRYVESRLDVARTAGEGG